jgi:hypothetical protein
MSDSLNISVKYSRDNNNWENDVINPSATQTTVYKKTTISSDSGDSKSIIDTLKYPKSIVRVTYKYGTSYSTESAPDE